MKNIKNMDSNPLKSQHVHEDKYNSFMKICKTTKGLHKSVKLKKNEPKLI